MTDLIALVLILSVSIIHILGLLIRLVGCPPFWHRKQMVMLRNIMEGKYSFSSPEWDGITGWKIIIF